MASKIDCPANVQEALQLNCGANAKGGDISVCKYFCRDKSGEPFLPSHWGGCGPDIQRPECAPAFGRCAGEGYGGPECCQWGQDCNWKSDYGSYCED